MRERERQTDKRSSICWVTCQKATTAVAVQAEAGRLELWVSNMGGWWPRTWHLLWFPVCVCKKPVRNGAVGMPEAGSCLTHWTVPGNGLSRKVFKDWDELVNFWRLLGKSWWVNKPPVCLLKLGFHSAHTGTLVCISKGWPPVLEKGPVGLWMVHITNRTEMQFQAF